MRVRVTHRGLARGAGARDNVGVGMDRRLDPRVGKVDDILALEEVHLLNAGDLVHAQALEGALQLLVIHTGGLAGDGLLAVRETGRR